VVVLVVELFKVEHLEVVEVEQVVCYHLIVLHYLLNFYQQDVIQLLLVEVEQRVVHNQILVIMEMIQVLEV